MLAVAVALSLVAPPGAAAPAARESAAIVRIDAGAVRGVVAGDHRMFAGIPYATVPRRWSPPADPVPWPFERDATRPGPPCPQPLAWQAAEDCLSLNVWTPPPAPGARRRPVMVWFHGGSLVTGSGADYEAKRLVARDVLVVTVNYRLGALGWLAHPAFERPGNYGFMDQQAALRWVRRNIGAFGGDPAAVTIAGESAGGIAVCGHLASPASAGLFRAAIMQSGPCWSAEDGAARAASLAYATRLGCSTADCLRALPLGRLLESAPALPTTGHSALKDLVGPALVAGGPLLPLPTTEAVTRGRIAKVPLIVGSNHDEMRSLIWEATDAKGRPLTAGGYPGALAKLFPRHHERVLARYPLSAYDGKAGAALGSAQTDASVCAGVPLDASFARSGPTYTYEFDDQNAPWYLPGSFPMGAYHAAELPYLFEMPSRPVWFSFAQRRLSEAMIGYWASFVATGRPTVPGLPDMPRFDPAVPRVLSLAPDAVRVRDDFVADHHCDFWATVR